MGRPENFSAEAFPVAAEAGALLRRSVLQILLRRSSGRTILIDKILVKIGGEEFIQSREVFGRNNKLLFRWVGFAFSRVPITGFRIRGEHEVRRRRVSFQDDYRRSARDGCRLTMLDAAADVAAGVEVQREIGARVTAIGPTIDFGAIGAQCGGYGFFGGGAVGPSGGGGNVAFVARRWRSSSSVRPTCF